MQVHWQIEGRDYRHMRSFTTHVPDDALEQCADEFEREDFIDQCIHEDFCRWINWVRIEE